MTLLALFGLLALLWIGFAVGMVAACLMVMAKEVDERTAAELEGTKCEPPE